MKWSQPWPDAGVLCSRLDALCSGIKHHDKPDQEVAHGLAVTVRLTVVGVTFP